MLCAMAKPALGRGLGALLGGVVSIPGRNGPASPPPATASAATPNKPVGEAVQIVPLSRIRPSALQPRKDFPAAALQELADSIKEKGIVQPLLVREHEGQFELIAGERRWRAAQLAGITEAPIIVRQADDRTALELALIENLQRENLNPMEEALGYRQLIDQFKLSQEEAGVKVGKSRVAVANALRLLNLAPEMQAWIRDGRLSVGHAKVILGLLSPDQQTQAGHRVLKDGLTVRQTEELVSHWLSRPTPTSGSGGKTVTPPLQSRDTHVVALENKLRERLGTKVSLRYRQGKGSMEVRFYSDGELERLLQILGVTAD
jgi:ParB family transcriptional regulator, chromosome partitioning protein